MSYHIQNHFFKLHLMLHMCSRRFELLVINAELVKLGCFFL